MSSNSDNKKSIVKLKTYIYSIILFVLGTFFFIFPYIVFFKKYELLFPILSELGGLLLVTATISLIWEVGLRRSFLSEILAKMDLKQDVVNTRLTRIDVSFKNIEDSIWKQLFKSVKKLDLLFCYAYSWRHGNDQDLVKVAQRKDTRIRVILPNPDDSQTINVLAQRFNYTNNEMKDKVNESIQFFKNLKINYNANLNLWVINDSLVYSIYRFDNTIIVATFKHQKPKEISVPSFICEKGGNLFDFYKKEFNFLINSGSQIKIV